MRERLDTIHHGYGSMQCAKQFVQRYAFGRQLVDDAALAHDQDAVADLQQFLQLAGDEDRADALAG